MSPVLLVENLAKSYGKNQAALSGVDLRVLRGETIVVTGPSGCGKSTLLRCIVRLISPDSGKIIVTGEDVHPVLFTILDVRGA